MAKRKEAEERIANDKNTIDEYFNLTQVVKGREDYDKFINIVFSVLCEASS
jgi:hypothetical protein